MIAFGNSVAAAPPFVSHSNNHPQPYRRLGIRFLKNIDIMVPFFLTFPQQEFYTLNDTGATFLTLLYQHLLSLLTFDILVSTVYTTVSQRGLIAILCFTYL